MPIWLGESGENKDEWIAAFTKTLEDNRVGWCFWPYKKMDATSSAVTFDRPVHWDEIVKFAALPPGTGNAEKRIAARPSADDIQAAFDDLLIKTRFTSERVNAGYMQGAWSDPGCTLGTYIQPRLPLYTYAKPMRTRVLIASLVVAVPAMLVRTH